MMLGERSINASSSSSSSSLSSSVCYREWKFAMEIRFNDLNSTALINRLVGFNLDLRTLHQRSKIGKCYDQIVWFCTHKHFLTLDKTTSAPHSILIELYLCIHGQFFREKVKLIREKCRREYKLRSQCKFNQRRSSIALYTTQIIIYLIFRLSNPVNIYRAVQYLVSRDLD